MGPLRAGNRFWNSLGRPDRRPSAGQERGDALPLNQPRWKEPAMTTDTRRMTRWGVFGCVAGSLLLLLGSVVLLWWVCATSAAPPAADEPAPAGPDSLDRLKAFPLAPRPGNRDPSPLDALNRRDREPSFRPGLPAEVVAVVGPWRGKQYLTGANVIAPS